MLEITRLIPRLCSVKGIMIETIRTKYSKGQIIHRIMKEQKQCFGALLETQSQKNKRLKLERKGRIVSKAAGSKVDSELPWMLKNAKLRYVKIKSSPVAKPSTLAAIPERVVLIKTANKHERACFEAAEGVLLTLQKGTRSSNIDKKITKTHSLVQKRIIQRSSVIPKLENAIESSGATRILQSDKVIRNIERTPLYYDEEDSCQNVWNTRQILSISRTADEEFSAYPSVTRILNATMSDKAKEMLERWKARMIGILGQEGFETYKADLLENGKLLHSTIDSTLRKKPFDVPLNLKNCYDSIKSVLKEVKNVRAIESHVVHRDLGYRGVVDCVATYKGNFCLIDWKKSDKPKVLLSSTYDAPLQIASYIGALNADKNYPFQIKSGLLVIAYSLGDKPTVHPIVEAELQYYWKRWLERLKKYHEMQNT